MKPRRKPLMALLGRNATEADVAAFVAALNGDPAPQAIAADPLLKYIPLEEAPSGFWQMPPEMRSKRGRVHIMARCAGSGSILAWMLTMKVGPEADKFADDLLASNAQRAVIEGMTPDERILEMLRINGGWVQSGD